MIVLFIHQNFPGQYKYLIQHCRDAWKAKIYFITRSRQLEVDGVEKVIYEPEPQVGASCHPYTLDIDQSIRAGVAVADACRALKARGIEPDVVLGHNGWGEMLFVKDVFPNAPVLSYFEFYYHAANVDVGFDPEFGPGVDPFRLRTRNAVNLLGFDSADWGNTPTRWQRQVHPPELRSRISVIHEGIDTDAIRPDPNAWLYVEGAGLLDKQTEIVTYVARNLEPYRGFHVFMRALPRILQRRPKAHVCVIGGDEVSYGAVFDDGSTYRQRLLTELGGFIDRSRVHFLGRVPYETYLKVLQVSSAHVYLTYPFVLSWSCLEAMSAGCAIVGSDTPPVLEVLEDRTTGRIVDFFDPNDIADRVEELLEDRAQAKALGERARDQVVSRFDLTTRQLPAWDQLLKSLIDGRKPPLFFDA